MKYKLSQHARDVIKERDIPETWLEQVLNDPLKCEGDPADEELEHRFGRINEYGNRVLHVVINRSTDPVKIVTACFDRKKKDQL